MITIVIADDTPAMFGSWSILLSVQELLVTQYSECQYHILFLCVYTHQLSINEPSGDADSKGSTDGCIKCVVHPAQHSPTYPFFYLRSVSSYYICRVWRRVALQFVLSMRLAVPAVQTILPVEK
jgi:hypothetical protein